jgi:hypothetical protein
MGNITHMCDFCGWHPKDPKRVPTFGNCSTPANNNGVLNNAQCAMSAANGTCPAGMGPCSNQAVGSARAANGKPGFPSGGNSQSIFPCYPADYVGTNSSLSAACANTVSRFWGSGALIVLSRTCYVLKLRAC